MLFRDDGNTENILSERYESNIEYEKPKAISIGLSKDEVKISICHSQSKLEVLFDESMQKVESTETMKDHRKTSAELFTFS